LPPRENGPSVPEPFLASGGSQEEEGRENEQGEGQDEEAEGQPREEPPFPDVPDPEGLSAVADPETRESLRAIFRRSGGK